MLLSHKMIASSSVSAVEVAAAETTVELSAYDTHTSVLPSVFDVSLSVQTLGDNGEFTFTIGGQQVAASSSFVTTFVYPGTTLELSFSERQTAFHFTGDGSTEITIPPEHTHVTIDGVETAVNIPGFTTTLVLTGSSNIILNIPATTAQMTVPEATYVFSAITASVTGAENKDCGDQQLEAAAQGKTCVMGTTFALTLPSSADNLYLHANGLTTSFALEGITTTFVPEQTIAIKREDPTEISFILTEP